MKLLTSPTAVYVTNEPRTRFVFATLGWIIPGPQAQELRTRLTERLSKMHGQGQLIHETWSHSLGVLTLTLTLVPPASAENVPNYLLELTHDESPNALSIVAPPVVSDRLRAADDTALDEIVVFPALQPLRSNMQQRRIDGFEQVLIAGAAPRGNHAASFLALCLLSAGPGTLLPDSIEAPGLGSVNVTRTLTGHTPSLLWQVVTQGSGFEVLQRTLEVIDVFAGDVPSQKFELAREFAQANLSRAWRNPIELSQNVVRYELMGWGGILIEQPREALSQADSLDAGKSLIDFTVPIREVLGLT